MLIVGHAHASREHGTRRIVGHAHASREYGTRIAWPKPSWQVGG